MLKNEFPVFASCAFAQTNPCAILPAVPTKKAFYISPCSAALTSFFIAAVALTRLDCCFRVLLDVLCERAALIIRLLKLALVVTPHIALVGSRID